MENNNSSEQKQIDFIPEFLDYDVDVIIKEGLQIVVISMEFVEYVTIRFTFPINYPKKVIIPNVGILTKSDKFFESKGVNVKANKNGDLMQNCTFTRIVRAFHKINESQSVNTIINEIIETYF